MKRGIIIVRIHGAVMKMELTGWRKQEAETNQPGYKAAIGISAGEPMGLFL